MKYERLTIRETLYYIWLCESISASKIKVVKIRENTITFDTESGDTFLLEHIGKAIFLTKADAEK